ncbi:MAG: hypothetical protein Alis3KO_36660 [Aliiglaciecola sp.]|uniref:hypothetical protein n=1 Tax=Aliiglaciecola sp. M165 TaxID=2593649 RepID=UPI00117E438A|nr:hypothetical protein [Aliiglaciecola sp. M165]TRY33385.1 hypothetical protein FM019_05265 [Aliiglaciecola sp. M165]
MQFPNDINSLWEMWEKNVLAGGLEDDQADRLGQHIEQLEEQDNPTEKHSDEPQADALTKAHRILDQLCSKRKQIHPNHSQPGHRVMKTRFGAIYEDSIAVRGMERLLQRNANGHSAIKLKDGYYHVNHLPGVQPTASEQVNARNKNVEKVDVETVERFIRTCKATGMDKRGWKKTVNEEFDMSRQEFTKWLLRYFPLFDLPVPIDKKS